MSAPNLAFNLRHITAEVSCEDVGCTTATHHAIHTEPTGDATLTISGPAEIVRAVAAAALPFFAPVLDPPPQVEYCNWCPTPSAPSLIHHPDGQARHFVPANTFRWAVHPTHGKLSEVTDGNFLCERCDRYVKIDGDKVTVLGLAECEPTADASYVCTAHGPHPHDSNGEPTRCLDCSECLSSDRHVSVLDKSSDDD